MSRRLPPTLVGLSPGDLTAGKTREFLERARKAVEVGLEGILVREPALGDRDLLQLAQEVREILRERGWLGIHDRAHLAAPSDANAVHLGFRSLAPAEARGILPDGIAIGLSAHAADDPVRWCEADYLFFGPVLDTPSKRGLLEAVGFEGLAAAVERSSLPVWAIGGLRPEHGRSCLEAKCSGLAVLSGILARWDAADACTAYLSGLRCGGAIVRGVESTGGH